jgi:hypothetical protein
VQPWVIWRGDQHLHAACRHVQVGQGGRGPGRPRGARNRVGAELAKETLHAAADTGFMVRDDDGNWKPTNEGGVRGYLRWATINEPKTYLGMIARVLPFNVVQEHPEEPILTHEQVLAQLEERGLPTDLVNVLREGRILARPPRPRRPHRPRAAKVRADCRPNAGGGKTGRANKRRWCWRFCAQ